MKNEFVNKKNFDMELIKNPKLKHTVWMALSRMQITLTPLLYINYLHAICNTHYKVAIDILKLIDIIGPDYDQINELPEIGNAAGQALLEAILSDMQRCSKTYGGGFILGLINEMDLESNSEGLMTITEFIVDYINRMNDYVCNDR